MKERDQKKDDIDEVGSGSGKNLAGAHEAPAFTLGGLVEP